MSRPHPGPGAWQGVAAAWLLLLAGCSPAAEEEQVGRCVQDEQCPASQICSIGRCKDGCRTRDDCPAGQECVRERCTVVQDAGEEPVDGGGEPDSGGCRDDELLTVCPDGDGDGHGDPVQATRACPPVLAGWSERCDDCDDRDPLVGACARCPGEMAEIDGRFCIDRWEASRPDATAETQGALVGRAESRPGVIPWHVFAMNQDALRTFTAACQAAGKRLCTPAEWSAVCTGPTPTRYFFGDVWDREACNCVDAYCDDHCLAQGLPSCDTAENCGYEYGCYRIAATGSFPRCTNDYGVFDVNGNVWEIVPAPSARGYQVRGGAFNCAGPSLRLECSFDAGWNELFAGFRCCKDPASG